MGQCTSTGKNRRLYLDAGLNKQLGLSNELFVLGDSLVLTVLGQVSFMPVLVLAARLCPEVRGYTIKDVAQQLTLRHCKSLSVDLPCSSQRLIARFKDLVL